MNGIKVLITCGEVDVEEEDTAFKGRVWGTWKKIVRSGIYCRKQFWDFWSYQGLWLASGKGRRLQALRCTDWEGHYWCPSVLCWFFSRPWSANIKPLNSWDNLWIGSSRYLPLSVELSPYSTYDILLQHCYHFQCCVTTNDWSICLGRDQKGIEVTKWGNFIKHLLLHNREAF